MQAPRFVGGESSRELAKTSMEAELPHTRDHVVRYYGRLLSLTITAHLRPYPMTNLHRQCIDIQILYIPHFKYITPLCRMWFSSYGGVRKYLWILCKVSNTNQIRFVFMLPIVPAYPNVMDKVMLGLIPGKQEKLIVVPPLVSSAPCPID